MVFTFSIFLSQLLVIELYTSAIWSLVWEGSTVTINDLQWEHSGNRNPYSHKSFLTQGADVPLPLGNCNSWLPIGIWTGQCHCLGPAGTIIVINIVIHVNFCSLFISSLSFTIYIPTSLARLILRQDLETSVRLTGRGKIVDAKHMILMLL